MAEAFERLAHVPRKASNVCSLAARHFELRAVLASGHEPERMDHDRPTLQPGRFAAARKGVRPLAVDMNCREVRWPLEDLSREGRHACGDVGRARAVGGPADRLSRGIVGIA